MRSKAALPRLSSALPKPPSSKFAACLGYRRSASKYATSARITPAANCTAFTIRAVPPASRPPSPANCPGHNGEPLIILWMRTAQRHDVVKPKTFLRTLFHELGHYLDYALLRL